MKSVIPITLVFLSRLATFSASAQEPQKLELYLETGHTEYVSSAVFSPDGKTIVSAAIDGTMKLWDVASGQELATVKGFDRFAFSPDEKTAALSFGPDKAIILWDIASWRKRYTLPWDGGVFRSIVAFSPDSKTMVSWNPTTLTLWDVESGRELHTLKAQIDTSVPMYSQDWGRTTISADWNTIAWRADGRITLLDGTSGQELHALTADNSFSKVLFSADGETDRLVEQHKPKAVGRSIWARTLHQECGSE